MGTKSRGGGGAAAAAAAAAAERRRGGFVEIVNEAKRGRGGERGRGGDREEAIGDELESSREREVEVKMETHT